MTLEYLLEGKIHSKDKKLKLLFDVYLYALILIIQIYEIITNLFFWYLRRSHNWSKPKLMFQH
jgi:hypothetical protein